MTGRTCETCRHHRWDTVAGRTDSRCMRWLTITDGRRIQDVSTAGETERDALPGRAAGDVCGPTRRNWEAANG